MGDEGSVVAEIVRLALLLFMMSVKKHMAVQCYLSATQLTKSRYLLERGGVGWGGVGWLEDLHVGLL